MIDDQEVKELSKLHPRNRKPACIFNGDIAVVHSQWFVLEVPKDVVGVSDWPGTPIEFIRQWKYEQLPEGEGEPAQPMRATWEVDDEQLPVIRLLSDDLRGHIPVWAYEFVKRHVDDPEFRLFAGNRRDGAPANVGVYAKGKVVGVIAQIVEEVQDGWSTSL